MANYKHRRSTTALASCFLVFGASAPINAQMLVGDGSIPCGATYTVSAGDTLSQLAARAYGDTQLYGFIADANWDTLGGNINNVAVGTTLDIPCVDAGGNALNAKETDEVAASIKSVVDVESLLTPEQIDTMFGPVALFPDPVLSPLLVAVTFPLDVVKAGRFVEETANLSDQQRAEQSASQEWDQSVRDITAAFPDLVTRMSTHIDWTEQAGEAVLAQTDDVLDSIQRLRAKAQENGYLVDNQAQTIETQGDTIIIAPADPTVVYVPTYDSQVVYSAPATTAVAPPQYYYGDYDDDDWQDFLVAGGIILGSAIILDEIFDDDDWDGWGDWNDDVDIDWDGGDISIDRGDINIDRDDISIDRDNINIGDAERPGLGDGERPGRGEGVSIGDLDRPGLGNNERPAGERSAAGAIAAGGGAAVATQASRDAARQKIEKRQATGGNVASLPTRKPGSGASAATRPSAGALPSAPTRQAPVTKPSVARQPTARAPSASNTFSKPSGGARPSAASNRGRASAGRPSGGGRGGGGRR